MSRINFDLEDLYKRAFGVSPRPYDAPKDPFGCIEEPPYKINGSSVFNEDGTSRENKYKSATVKYKDGKIEQVAANASTSTNSGSTIRERNGSKDVWLPTRFIGLDKKIVESGNLLLPYTVVKITGKKTIVKTPMAERRGSVKEQYSIDDYVIDIKGFLIDEKNRVWPDEEIKTFEKLFTYKGAVDLDNALTNYFLKEEGSMQHLAVIESFELPEVEGGSVHIRPFSMVLESDSIFSLEKTIK